MKNNTMWVTKIEACLFVLTLIISLVMTFGVAHATSRTFNTGSYIISADSCWQPNNDTTDTVAGNPAYCDTNKNDKSLFQLFGMLYALLDVGDDAGNCINNDGTTPQQKAMLGYCKQIKVYWIIDNAKTSSQGSDLTLNLATASVATPIVTIYNSTKTGSVAPIGTTYVTKTSTGAATTIAYKGGPFVIDANDITQAEVNIMLAKFPSVKIHKVNIPFTGNVDKVLVGKPPKIAVLNEGSSDVLEAYIRAAGAFAWRDTVFQYVEARDIIAGCLEDPVPALCTTKRPDITAPFQLLWAPHWVIEDRWGDGSTPTAAEQQATVSNIRAFLERGNSGFFECASIESLEASSIAGMDVGTAGGFTIGSTKVLPRIEINGGCSDTGSCSSDYLKYEETPFWLTQCGGWKYSATSGHVHNMRPNLAKSYSYLTTKTADDSSTTVDDKFVGTQMTRFIHDDTTKLNASYTPGTGTSAGYYVYDYLTGGRINGSPTQGYVVYLPGHSYIKCTNTTTYVNPPSRTLEFNFNTDPPTASSIYIEVVHTGCTQGSTCPKVSYNLTTGVGTRSTTGGKVDLTAEFATFDTGSNKLSGVIFTSSDPNATSDLQITDIYTTFDGNLGTVKLTNIADLTGTTSRQSLCAPDQTSTLSPVSSVRCSLAAPASLMTLTFSRDISTEASKIVTVKLFYTGGPVTASYDFINGGTVAAVGNVTLDMRSVIYNAATHTLSNVIVKRGATCADVTLSDVEVTFPGEGSLNLIYNNTTNDEICSPAHESPAKCSGAYVPSPTEYFINTELYWQSLTPPPANSTLKLTYTCSPACTTSTITASRGNIVTNADLTLDFKNISASNTKLSNIKLTILDGDKTVTITKVLLTYTGSTASNKTVSYKDTTNNVTFFSVSTKTNPTEQTVTKTIPKPVLVAPPSSWTYLIGKGICSYYISPYLSSCDIDWGSSNTCGIKYVLNTFLALKYQSTSNEFSKTQPIVKDNILYKASYDYPSYRGHLKMIKVPTQNADTTYTSPVTVWDSATSIPVAGTGSFPSAPLSSIDATSPRYIFTTLPDSTSHIKFDPVSFAALDTTTRAALRTQLVAGTDNDAIVTINTVRGRKGASTTDVYPGTTNCFGAADGTIDLYGCAEDSKRLWAIEISTPALKTRSKLVDSTTEVPSAFAISAGKDRRDRVLFAGADDGMLHAFSAGIYDPSTTNYPDTASGKGTGKEIWAYIPSTLLPHLKNQPFTPDPSNEATFEPKVSVDGSPRIDDFLIKTSTSPDTWQWKTRLVGTAMVRSQNVGIVYALDVTDHYNPQLLWEKSYNVTSDTGCSGVKRNCNMGNSAGVSIGKVLLGNEIKNYVFLTSSWVSPVGGVYGINAYALDLDNGNVIWKTSIPYTSDAVGINVTPAAPALMDRDNNGSYDYVVLGDMQGRVWALSTKDGTNLTGATTPAYQVKTLGSDGKDATPVIYTNSAEPIGASVSVYRDYVVLATGGADYASDSRDYRVEVIRLKLDGGVKEDNFTVQTGYTLGGVAVHGEKIWAQPTLTDDLKVYIPTAKSYFSSQTVSSLQSVGRIIVLDLRIMRTVASPTANIAVVGGTDVAAQVVAGGFVGGFGFDNKSAYTVSLKSTDGKSLFQIGSGAGAGVSTPALKENTENPYKILWWRKM